MNFYFCHKTKKYMYLYELQYPTLNVGRLRARQPSRIINFSLRRNLVKATLRERPWVQNYSFPFFE